MLFTTSSTVAESARAGLNSKTARSLALLESGSSSSLRRDGLAPAPLITGQDKLEKIETQGPSRIN